MFRRPNPVFSDEYRAIVQVLVQARREAGLTQRQLAARLGKATSHICMIETGQRRVDTLELYKMAHCFGVDPVRLYARISQQVDEVRVETCQMEPAAH